MVAGEYPPMKGGVGAFTREVARAMVKAGHEVFVFTRNSGADESDDGVHVAAHVTGKWTRKANAAVSQWAAAHQVDVVNIQFQTAAYDLAGAIHSLPRKLAVDVPCFVTFHDLREPYLFPKAGPLRKRAVQKLANDSIGIIATDRADEEVLCDAWHIPNVRWIPIGSNVTTTPPHGYVREAWRQKMSVAAEDLLICYFGFLNESKGGETLIEAVAKLTSDGAPCKLVMIGDRAGSSDPTNHAYAQRIDRLIEQHHLADKVIWTGFREDEEVSAFFLASDICALPYQDGVSLRRGTLMAALAHGMPIVTTEPQTIAPELDGVVEVVPTRNSAALAEAIKRVWKDSQLRNQLAANALDASKHFEWPSIAKNTIDYFQDIVTGAND